MLGYFREFPRDDRELTWKWGRQKDTDGGGVGGMLGKATERGPERQKTETGRARDRRWTRRKDRRKKLRRGGLGADGSGS